MNFTFQDFFAFDKMITPSIIRILFIFIIVIEVIAGIVLTSDASCERA